MDDVQRHRGTDYDVVLFLELVECKSEPDFAEFLRALRNWGGWKRQIPFQLLISETNPDAPDNWVNQRYGDENMAAMMARAEAEGVPYTVQRLVSRHEDNPKWYDAEAREWHVEGKAYIAGLDAIPGVRGKRLRHGLWVGAEGVVYENFDRKRHLIERPKPRPTFRAYVAAMDWGYTDPCCLLIAGVERDTGHLHIVGEVYRKKMSIDWWADRLVDLRAEFDSSKSGAYWRVVVVDPSRPEVIERFNRAVCAAPDAPFAIKAHNRRATTGDGDMGGIDTVRWYLEGRLVFWNDRMRFGPDSLLIEEKQPTSTIGEFGSYVYESAPRSGVEISNRRKELTDDSCPDHGMDALRYLCVFARDRYGKYVESAESGVRISWRQRKIAKDLGIDLPPEPGT
jgi:phage terminase large subunit